jgi:hypothetical protein
MTVCVSVCVDRRIILKCTAIHCLLRYGCVLGREGGEEFQLKFLFMVVTAGGG